jgi:energy-dependent translational throttle protein EttA
MTRFFRDSYVHWCEGNFDNYETRRRDRLGIEADQPHCINYKELQH